MTLPKNSHEHNANNIHTHEQDAKQYAVKLATLTLLLAILSCNHGNSNKKEDVKKDSISVNIATSEIEKYISDYKKEFNPQGKKYADLYAGYLGYFKKTPKGKVVLGCTQIGPTIDVCTDPGKIINLLWQIKFQRKQSDQFTAARQFYNGVVRNMDFTKSPKSSVEDYKNDIAESIKEVKNHVNYKAFNSAMEAESKIRLKRWIKKPKGVKPGIWDATKASLWEKICDKIDANMILSYNMTEFFPQGAPGGKTEYQLLEHILSNYGKDFVFYVPAVADKYASFGSYQFTSLALYDAADGTRGASIVNQYVDAEAKIPGSVVKLKGKEHHRAAYLFAMYNMYFMLRNMTPKELEKVETAVNNPLFAYNLPQLIAVGHNYPADLNDAAAIVMKNDKGIPIYEQMGGKHTEEYARKTFQNYVAVSQGVEIQNAPTIHLVDNVHMGAIEDKPDTKKHEPNKPNTKKIENKTPEKKSTKSTTTHTPKEQTIPTNKSLEFVRESHDRKYMIYSYTFQLITGGNVGGVKNKVKQTLGKKAYGKEIIITDINGKEISKTKHFNRGEKIFVKVAK